MPKSDAGEVPDGPMTSEEQAIARALSQDLVDRIDAALLSQAKTRWRKVAMVVGLTMSETALRVPGLPDLFYAERVKALFARGDLLAQGNLDYMRYSEVRLP
jgi:hypothetical protein